MSSTASSTQIEVMRLKMELEVEISLSSLVKQESRTTPRIMAEELLRPSMDWM